MTVKQARKLLGKKAEGKTDEEIQETIEVGQFFVDVFFDMLKEGKIKVED